MCADGSYLPPALIYPAHSGNLQDLWLEDYDPEDGCYFASSPTGWTNNELAMNWLLRLFDDHTKAKARLNREPRLLFLDGHGSHINLPFLQECEKRNISVCAYPPHSTHRLQPLDISLFSPLSTYYSQALDEFLTTTQFLCRMTKRQFYKLFKQAFEKAFTEANIKSGWRKSGLHPFDPQAVLSQLSTNLETSTSRPTTASSSARSAISSSDWRKLNQMVRDAVGDALNVEGRRILKAVHRLQAENQLLKQQVEGLNEAVRIEKGKKKKKKKTLIQEVREDDGHGVGFFSPMKIKAALELNE